MGKTRVLLGGSTGHPLQRPQLSTGSADYLRLREWQVGCGVSEHRQEKEKMEKRVVLGLFRAVWELFGGQTPACESPGNLCIVSGTESWVRLRARGQLIY